MSASADLFKVLSVASRNHGFLSNDDIDSLATLDPDRGLLVRCNMGRFVIPAMYCRLVADAIDGAGRGDWVRDVSLPSTDPAFKGDLSRVTPSPIAHLGGARLPVPVLPAVNVYGGCSYNSSFDYEDCVSDADPGL